METVPQLLRDGALQNCPRDAQELEHVVVVEMRGGLVAQQNVLTLDWGAAGEQSEGVCGGAVGQTECFS